MRQACSDSHGATGAHGHAMWHLGERTRTTALWLMLGVLLAKSWSCCAAVHRRRLADRSGAKPQALQRWEGEGGQNEPPVGGGLAD